MDHEKELNEKWTAYNLVQEALKQYDTVHTSQETNAIKAVLRNEVTWAVFIIGAVWSSVVWVVLPLQKLQIQQEELRSTLVNIENSNEKVLNDHGALSTRINTLETKINYLFK